MNKKILKKQLDLLNTIVITSVYIREYFYYKK